MRWLMRVVAMPVAGAEPSFQVNSGGVISVVSTTIMTTAETVNLSRCLQIRVKKTKTNSTPGYRFPLEVIRLGVYRTRRRRCEHRRRVRSKDLATTARVARRAKPPPLAAERHRGRSIDIPHGGRCTAAPSALRSVQRYQLPRDLLPCNIEPIEEHCGLRSPRDRSVPPGSCSCRAQAYH